LSKICSNALATFATKELVMDAGSAAASSHRIAARELVTPEQLAGLRERVEWKGIALIAHAWCVILGAMAVVTVFPNPLTYIFAVMLIGSRQLGLAILMHEGAQPRSLACSCPGRLAACERIGTHCQKAHIA